MDEIEVKALEYLPLTESTFAILVALAEPRHGYGIMQAVAQADGGGIRLGPGTLYGALTKLLERPVHLFLNVKEREGWDEERARIRAIGLDDAG